MAYASDELGGASYTPNPQRGGNGKVAGFSMHPDPTTGQIAMSKVSPLGVGVWAVVGYLVGGTSGLVIGAIASVGLQLGVREVARDLYIKEGGTLS